MRKPFHTQHGRTVAWLLLLLLLQQARAQLVRDLLLQRTAASAPAIAAQLILLHGGLQEPPGTKLSDILLKRYLSNEEQVCQWTC